MTRSDCEIILHLFRERPYTFIDKLVGMFAFALKDKTTNNVYYVRDHVGILPLYWGATSGFESKSKSKSSSRPFLEWDSATLQCGSVIPSACPGKKIVSSNIQSFQKPGVVDVFEHFPPGHFWVGDSKTGQGELREWYRPQWK